MNKQVEAIRQEIERLKKILEESTYYLDNSQQALGYSFALDDFKEFIDSLPNDSLDAPKIVSEDLEEAANEFANQDCVTFISRKKGFIAGAEWQYQKDRGEFAKLKAKEWSDGYNEGIAKGKEQMTKDAVDGEIGYWNQRGLSILLDKSLEKLGYDEDIKVKIIIIKDKEGEE